MKITKFSLSFGPIHTHYLVEYKGNKRVIHANKQCLKLAIYDLLKQTK